MTIDQYLRPYSPTFRKAREELIGLAKVELSFCNPKSTPYICAATSSEEGMQTVVLKIVRLCEKTQMSVGEAISLVEIELNPHHPDAY